MSVYSTEFVEYNALSSPVQVASFKTSDIAVKSERRDNLVQNVVLKPRFGIVRPLEAGRDVMFLRITGSFR